MKKIFLLLFFLFSSVAAVSADDEVKNDYFSVNVPSDWQLLQDDNDNAITLSVYATKSRDTIVTTIIGSNGRADVATIVKSFAQQYKARDSLVRKDGQGMFIFKSYDGMDSTGYVTVYDRLYMVVTVSGNVRKARNFLKHFQSADYAELLPKL